MTIAVWTHEFRTDALGRRFFRDRSPQEWLQGVLDFAHHPYTEASAFFDNVDTLIITVAGPETTLRFVCGLLNQQAEQHPHDGTPIEEAERLEETLRAAPKLACPNCSEVGRWKVDCDVVNRTAVMLGGDKVWVDRVGAEDTKLLTVGAIDCQACGHPIREDERDWETFTELARKQLVDHDVPWAIMTDYRQF